MPAPSLNLNLHYRRCTTAACESTHSHCLRVTTQAYFAGVGNIYRAEILFVAGVHPDVKGVDLSRAEYDRIWAASVSLMERGFRTGPLMLST